MKKQFLLTAAAALLLAGSAQAQMKAGGSPTSINANAILEMESTNKGMLLPRISLVATTNFAPLSAHVAGMAVYNIATAGDVTPGYYFNDGTKWVRVIDQVANIYTQSGNLSSSRTIGLGSGNTLNFTGAGSGAALTVNGARNNIGVGTSTPDTSAIADFNSSNKGVLLPRIGLQSATDGATIPGPAKGLIVYNTNTALPSGGGLYVNNGTPTAPLWVAFAQRELPKSFLRYKAATGLAFLSASLFSGYKIVKFNAAGKEFDENDEYNETAGAFIAKQSGIYSIYAQSDSKGAIGIDDYGVGIFKTDSGATTPNLIAEEQYTNVGIGVGFITVNVSPPTRSAQTLVKLKTGDKIQFGLLSPLVNLNLLTTSQTYFTIHQVK